MSCRAGVLELFVSWVASIGFLLLTGGLLGRAFCLRRLITVREARMVRASNRLLWSGAAIYAMAKIALHLLPSRQNFQLVQCLLLVGVLALDIWPARRFKSWARHLDLDQIPYHTDADQDRMRRLWRIQVAFLLAFPLVEELGRAGCAGIFGN